MMSLAYLELDATGLAGAVRVNDLPAVALLAGGTRAYVPVPVLLVRGRNTLSVRVRPEGDERRLWVRVALFDDGDEFFTGAGRTLGAIEVPPLSGAAQVTFDSPVGPPAWAWHGCRSWTTPQEALTSAAPFIAALTAAFRAGNSATLIAACAPYIGDLALAFPHQPPGHYARQMATYLSTPRTLDPATPDGSVLCGEGRLLHVLARDGGDLIRGRDADGPFTWRALIGLHAGGWKVIR